jgi:hypothetical protein
MSTTMSSDSSQNGPPSSSSRNPPTSLIVTRPALASFTSPSFPEPTPPSMTRLRSKFDGERIYEFEAPQFYDFTKHSDPERGHLDENWFGNMWKNNQFVHLLTARLFFFRFEKENSFKS